MHLETLIQGLITALEKNTAALLANPGVAARASQDADNAAREALQKARDTSKEAPAKPDPKAPAPAPKTETAGTVSYEKDIKGWALAIAKKDRPSLSAIWDHFKVKVGAELKPEQLAEAKKLIDAKCAELGITAPAVATKAA